MKKLVVLALIGSAMVATPASAGSRSAGVDGDWLDAFCALYPLRSICRNR